MKKFQNKFLRNKAFVDAQLWIFNGFSAISLGFYFALFSAGNPEKFSISLQLATILYGIGLATNSTLSFIILISDKDEELLDNLNRSKYFGWIPIVAMYSVGLATLSLISFYSWLAFITVILTILATVYLFFQAMKAEINQFKKMSIESEIEILNMQLENLKNSQKKESRE